METKTKKAKRVKPKVMQPVDVGEYTLLNDEKVGRALDNIGVNGTDEQLIVEYDRLGGAIKFEGRKLAMGAFYDFEEKKAREEVNLGEDQFEDEYVLQRKPRKVTREKGEDVLKRVKALRAKGSEVTPPVVEALPVEVPVVEKKKQVVPATATTKEDVKVLLDKKGVKYDGRASLETLKKLL